MAPRGRDLTGDFDERLSRTVSFILRHDPSSHGLSLDENGWVPLPDFLAVLRKANVEWAAITSEDLRKMIAESRKQRHQICGDRIRALYGHSTPGKVSHKIALPPSTLFHGTTDHAWELIQSDGLRPMGRQFVHLSVDRETAEAVGKRRGEAPTVLRIRATDAHHAGIEFLVGNDHVWLVSYLPNQYISVEEA